MCATTIEPVHMLNIEIFQWILQKFDLLVQRNLLFIKTYILWGP